MQTKQNARKNYGRFFETIGKDDAYERKQKIAQGSS